MYQKAYPDQFLNFESDVTESNVEGNVLRKLYLPSWPCRKLWYCKRKEIRGDCSDTVDFLLLLYVEEEAWRTKEVTITYYKWSEGAGIGLALLRFLLLKNVLRQSLN